MRTFTFLACLLLALGVNAQENSTEEEFCGYTAVNGLTSQRNNQKCGVLIDDLMLPYNAMYKGTLTLQLTGNPSECPQSTYTMEDYTVGIGGMKVNSNSTLDRSTYDTNPFYLWFKYQENANISAGFLSSTDYFVTESQWWQLGSTKSGDGFDITGNYTGTLAPYSNVFNYPSDACWTVNIYNHIVSADMSDPNDYHFWQIYGHISPTSANITVDQTIWDGNEWHTRFTFVGESTGDVKLVTTEDTPTTDLAVKGVEAAEGGGSGNATGGGNKTSGGVILGQDGTRGLVVWGSLVAVLAVALSTL